MSRLFKWLHRIPSIKEAGAETLEGTKRARVIIRRYNEADAALKALIQENHFKQFLRYSKERE
ncbi:hypothetical protein D1872_68440 [compost metagenome]